MDLQLTDTQMLLRDTVREYLEREVPLSRTREVEKAGGADEALWAAMVEHGWLGAPFASDLGGGDGGLIEAGLVVEELARRAAIVPATEVLAVCSTVQRHGEPAVARRLIQAVLAGTERPVPAVLERADRFDVIDAVADDGMVRGEKYFVDFADFATHHAVVARHADTPGLYRVAAADPAVKSEATRSLGRFPQAIVRYDGASAERLTGPVGHAFLIRVARALTTVQLVACMQQSLDQSIAYTSIREQFGQKIGSFQAVQHHVADMSIHLESARFLAYEALDALEKGTATDAQIAAAKAAASRSVAEVTLLGHQVHGGQGYIEENDLYFFTLRGKDRALAWGTAEECLSIVADSVDAAEDWL